MGNASPGRKALRSQALRTVHGSQAAERTGLASATQNHTFGGRVRPVDCYWAVAAIQGLF